MNFRITAQDVQDKFTDSKGNTIVSLKDAEKIAKIINHEREILEVTLIDGGIEIE